MIFFHQIRTKADEIYLVVFQAKEMYLDHRNAWVHTFHVDLCKMSLLNRLMSGFADKRRHYEMLCEAIRGTAVNITKSLDHCIVEETRCGF